MTNPIFIQLVQIPHGPVKFAPNFIERFFKNTIDQIDNERRESRRVPMVAIYTNNGLKAGR